ncbi:LacI family DNA-binding transcriptional regulator [Kribbella sp. NPDC005582]|uniref:LacI family DNA-binding transcriptional regulator n=1 Tax=Kribbella sp. NPDC005582 TaxID=3156893 RepID=UPI0033BB8425
MRHTILDVAKLAGVSPATVSRTLGGTYPVAGKTRARVMRAVEELDYVANGHARALHGTGTGVIAMLLWDISSPSFGLLASGVEEEAARQGRLCMVCTTNGDVTRESEAIDLLRAQGAEAVILVGGAVDDDAYRARMDRYARLLSSAGTRLVLCGRPPAAGSAADAVVVDYDNEGGAYGATGHLLDAGHRRILFLGGVPGQSTAEGRKAGYLRALESRGIEPDPELLATGDFQRDPGYRAVRAALAKGTSFTAVFASSDLVASGAYLALREAGLDVPGDVSVVGYDDIPLALDLYPKLTTVRVPFEEVGRTAVRLLLDRRPDEPAQLTLGTNVVVRGSVGPPASSRS